MKIEGKYENIIIVVYSCMGDIRVRETAFQPFTVFKFFKGLKSFPTSQLSGKIFIVIFIFMFILNHLYT